LYHISCLCFACNESHWTRDIGTCIAFPKVATILTMFLWKIKQCVDQLWWAWIVWLWLYTKTWSKLKKVIKPRNWGQCQVIHPVPSIINVLTKYGENRLFGYGETDLITKTLLILSPPSFVSICIWRRHGGTRQWDTWYLFPRSTRSRDTWSFVFLTCDVF
jgi:hypothetical protein